MDKKIWDRCSDDAQGYIPVFGENLGNFYYKKIDDVEYFQYGRGSWYQWEDGVNFKRRCREVMVFREVAPKTVEELINSLELPSWAVSRNDQGLLVVGAQLCTKDGRRTGNAHVIEIDRKTYDGWEGLVYNCLTDAGNSFKFNENEIREFFHIGPFISLIGDVLEKFDRQKIFSESK